MLRVKAKGVIFLLDFSLAVCRQDIFFTLMLRFKNETSYNITVSDRKHFQLVSYSNKSLIFSQQQLKKLICASNIIFLLVVSC